MFVSVSPVLRTFYPLRVRAAFIMHSTNYGEVFCFSMGGVHRHVNLVLNVLEGLGFNTFSFLT